MPRVFIGLGSNLGDRRAHMELARRELAALPRTHSVAMSPVYETPPAGPVPQGPFLNAVVQLETELDPFDLLDYLHAIEKRAGRAAPDQRVRWGPRELDLDILLYDQRVVSSDELVIPHPLMHERWFVLRPLADLDPEFIHPVLEMRIGELLHYLEQATPQTRLDNPNATPHP